MGRLRSHVTLRRRKHWWTAFASPKLMVVAIPALALPLAAVIVFDTPTVPLTPVEQAIHSLPVASNTPLSPNTSLLGADPLPPATAQMLYANSARAITDRAAQP